MYLTHCTDAFMFYLLLSLKFRFRVMKFKDLKSLILLYRFILQSKNEINNQLMEKQKTADDKIKELEVKFFRAHISVIYRSCTLSLNQNKTG